tara:strand:- start:2671 stop:3081 length:411 start_codon:yes stop_codon:yes gene_type:complete
MIKKIGFIVYLFLIFGSFVAQAEEEAESVNIPFYFPMEPDIVTNYAALGFKLSYVRVAVSVMVSTANDLLVIEHHEPLLRAAFVALLGSEPEHKVKSSAGREAIRKECLRIANSLIESETGYSIIEDILFTKYIFN